MGGQMYRAEPVEAHGIIVAAVHRVHGEEAIGRLDEEAAQVFHNTSTHPHVRSSEVELCLIHGCAQER